MYFEVEFSITNQNFKPSFGIVNNISDGGYERGYAAGTVDGYTKGHADGQEVGYSEGYEKGNADGLAARTYEVWAITLVDGSVIEKEVAML